MQRIEIQVAKRDTTVAAKDVRRGGRLPGIIYGVGGPNIAVDVDSREFVHLGLGSSGAHLIRFASSDSALSTGVALIKDIQVHPVSGSPLHVDFLRVDPNKPVEAAVALSFVGKPAGVVEGGILQPLRRELQVRALPDKLPEVVEVDVTPLNIHDSVHVEEVTLPEGVEALFTENFTLVTVVPPVVEVEATAEGEEAVEGAEAAAAAEGGDAPAEGDKDKGE